MSAPDPSFDRKFSPNTPEGQIESAGLLARGLGPRRIKRAILVCLVVVVLLVLVTALAAI
jgi:hypothetical protein